MDLDTAEAIDTLRTDVHRVENEVRRVETSLTAKIDDVRRHMDVVTESLRDDIRMIAEGVVTLSAKVDSLRR